jgi:L-ascorbate metabolism protein UlaG (beta-lactamase superfamily)
MNTDNIIVNTQSSIRINLDIIIYFDPFKIEDECHDADIIFITHSHYDHFDIESINKIKNDNTIVVCPKSMENEINEIKFNEYHYLNPNEETTILGINIKTIPSYNNNKEFHPRSNNWLGYIVDYNDITYYIAGDTDKTKDNEMVKCDIALIPIGGHYTMDVNEAVELLKIIKPKIVIPTHYGSIVGSSTDGIKLQEKLKEYNIPVKEKLKFFN